MKRSRPQLHRKPVFEHGPGVVAQAEAVEAAKEWTGYDPRFAQAEREMRRDGAGDERRAGPKHVTLLTPASRAGDSSEHNSSSHPGMALELVHRTAMADAEAHNARSIHVVQPLG